MKPITILLLALLATGCVRKEDPPPAELVVLPEQPEPATVENSVASSTPQPVPVEEKQEETGNSPTVQEALDAVKRAHPRSLQVCYDKNTEVFLFEYPLEPKDGNYANTFWGSLYVRWDKIDFYRASNNTWFITAIPDDMYGRAWPVFAGLPCKAKESK